MRSPGTDISDIDVLLVNPPWVTKDKNVWRGIKGAVPPLGLLSIAAYLEQQGRRVRLMDVHVERWGMDDFRAQLGTCTPRYVGITTTTATAIAANRVAKIVKEVHPKCTLVFGGAHAVAVPVECLRNSAIDMVVRGDGERTFARIVSGEPVETIRGVTYRVGDRVVHNPAADVINDLDNLPMPAYHLVPMKKYYPAIGAYRRLPAINMFMTRGCPGKCTFCNSAETPLRTRSAELVVEEIAFMRERYGIREIQFYDDTFTIFKKNVMRFCALMKERNLGVTFTAFIRTDTFSASMARALKAAGCHQVMFGIESGDDQILKNIRKPIDRKRTYKAVKTAQAAGLEVRATFMLGNPGETVETMERTIRYALEIDPDLAIFNITTPYPGTQLYDWAKARGYLRTEDWGEYELSRSILILPTVTAEAIDVAYKRAHRVFYNRASMFARRLKRIRSLSHLIDNVHAFCYIVLRIDILRRGRAKHEWVEGVKEDFWDAPLRLEGPDVTLLTSASMQRAGVEVPPPDGPTPSTSATLPMLAS